MRAIAVLGAGRMAFAVARVVARSARPEAVQLWARREEARDEMAKEVPGIVCHPTVQSACEHADLIAFAVPASALRSVARDFGDVARGDQLVLQAVRGVEPDPESPRAFLLPHEVLRQETCVRKIGVLGGPLHAGELLGGHPLAVVLASRFDETRQALGALLRGTSLKLHASRDVVGVEVAGAVSNVSALATGMCEGLGMGETSRGVLLTHGLHEAKRLGLELGAEASTFAGLAGVGDLIPRKVTSTQRHHDVGAKLAAGQSEADALASVQGEVEGIAVARAVNRAAAHLGLELPLVRAVAQVLDGKADARSALEGVLHLDLALD